MRRDVEAGQRNESEVEIRNGLGEDDEVVLHPSNEIEDGVRVEPRGGGGAP